MENLFLVVIIVFGLWLIILSLSIFWYLKRRSKGINENISWEEFAKNADKRLNDLQKQFNRYEQNSIFFVQKIGFLRFNPFDETGGDQSYSITLLDGKDNGFVLTSLHTRSSTRTYAKVIKNGTSSYGLSEEEQKVIEKAKANEKNN